MNYNDIKELLLDDSKALTSAQAREILLVWNKNPNLLKALLTEENCYCLLEQYYDYSEDDNTHYFVKSKYKFLSEKIVLKFLELKNDFISSSFLGTTSAIILEQEMDAEAIVFAWPFLTERFYNCMTFGVIKYLIASSCFVFNFAKDDTGDIFGSFVDVVKDDVYMVELLGVNSFNILSFVSNSKFVDRMGFINAISLYAYSSHVFINDAENYGIYRKLFIRYMLYVINTVTTAQKSYKANFEDSNIEKVN